MAGRDTQRELGGLAAVVTGSARNIGRAIALALAEGGAAVLVNARTARGEAEAAAEAIRARGGRAEVFLADVTVAAEAEAMVAAALAAFGRLDVLVNNVSARSECAFADMSYAAWHGVLESTLGSAFHCTKAALPHLLASGRGAVVNIGGVASHAGIAGRAHVAAAKAGLCGMTGALAVELAPGNITVNCVVPALINTDRGGGAVPPHYAGRPIPMGRVGEPEEVAALVRFLAGPGARFISGQSIHANGAWLVTI